MIKLMVGTITYENVWQGLLDVSRARHCFALSEKRYVCWAYGLGFALAFAGVGALASLLEESPAWLAP